MLERLLETLFFCGGAALELETRHARPTTGKADRWTAVAITAPALPVANAIGRAVRGWLQASYGKGVLLVAAETEAGASPKAGASASSSGITSNSGSATLSALLAVAEAISARCGRTVLAADILLEERILIVHCGATDLGGSGREGTEAAREVLRSVGRVLQMATRLFHCGEAGVAIATTASELFPSNLYSELCPEESEGALGEWLRLDARSAGTVIAVPCRRSHAARRCVCIGRRGGGSPPSLKVRRSAAVAVGRKRKSWWLFLMAGAGWGRGSFRCSSLSSPCRQSTPPQMRGGTRVRAPG